MTVKASRSPPHDGWCFSLRSIEWGAEEADATEMPVRLIGGPGFWADRVAPSRPYRVNWQVSAIDADGGTVTLSIIIADSSDMSLNAATIIERVVTAPGAFEDTFDFRTAMQLHGIELTGDKWISCRVEFVGSGGAEYCNYGCDVRAL